MYNKILVTIDCSPADRIIINHVKNLAVVHKSQIFLIHVVHSHTRDQERFMMKASQKCLDDAVKNFQAAGIKVEIIIKKGDPDEQILEEINANTYDLIAMATHGHNFFGDILFGSVSNTLKHKISTPLLLIKAGGEE